jgi:hypothetical protein
MGSGRIRAGDGATRSRIAWRSKLRPCVLAKLVLYLGLPGSTTASPGACRFTIRPEMTLNRLSRKPARPIRSVTAISSGAAPPGRTAK